MSDFAFTPVAIPGSKSAGRRPEPNPFDHAVGSLIGGDGSLSPDALSFTVDDATWETSQVQKITRQLARAGKAHGISVFKRLEPTADGLGTVVVFWAQPRVYPAQRKAAGSEE